MFGINLIEWVGYLASMLVAISLLMSSIVKLRWLNLIGAVLFTIYGFTIEALPVGIINAFIIVINIYYLIKIYSEKEYFKILEVSIRDKYLTHFLEFYLKNIKELLPEFNLTDSEDIIAFFVLRNLVPAGIFVARKYDDTSLIIDLDFVIPEYRDFKIGKYIFEEHKKYFINKGYRYLYSPPHSEEHTKYLRKMGFKAANTGNKKLLVKAIS